MLPPPDQLIEWVLRELSLAPPQQGESSRDYLSISPFLPALWLCVSQFRIDIAIRDVYHSHALSFPCGCPRWWLITSLG